MSFNQLDLFGENPNNNIPRNDLELIKTVQGLEYKENFINEVEHNEIWDAVCSSPWLGDLKRRVQHYGYKYDYRKRAIDHSMFVGEIPDWSVKYAQRLVDLGYIDIIPDQIIVNEYTPGQGIADHIDCEPCFADTVISLSLGSDIVMQLKEKGNRPNQVDILLESKSLIILKGDSRYKWTHGIPSRKRDTFNGERFNRDRRISLTFRKVKLVE